MTHEDIEKALTSSEDIHVVFCADPSTHQGYVLDGPFEQVLDIFKGLHGIDFDKVYVVYLMDTKNGTNVDITDFISEQYYMYHVSNFSEFITYEHELY